MRRLFALVGVALAVGGQVALMQTSGNDPNERSVQALAGALLIVGALLFGLLVSRTTEHFPRLEFPRRWVSKPASRWRGPWLLGWVLVALVLAGITIALFVTNGESLIVGLLWLASIAALFIATLSKPRSLRPRITRRELLYLLVLVVVLVVALFMRIYRLTTLPYNLDGDFADFGLQARALAQGPQPLIFAFGWAAIPVLGYLPAWLTMSIWGTGLAGLNASGVVEGLLIILGVYLLGRDLFHARVGLFAAAILTISYAHLAASRESAYIDPVLFLLYGIYFLLMGLRKGRGWAVVASGLLTALCIQMYYSGRVIVFIVAFILLYLLVFRPRWLLARAWVVILWGLAVVVTLGPILIVFAQNTDGFMSRTNDVFILNPDVVRHMEGVYQVDSIPAMLLEQARHTVLLFNYYPDRGTQFSMAQPFLDPFLAVLFFLGVGFALVRLRWLSYTVLLGWVVLGMIVGCFLTVNAPFWPRLMILLPPVGLLAAVALNQLYELLLRVLARIEKRAVILAPVVLAAAVVGVGVLNWNTYVTAKGSYFTPATGISRYIDAQAPSARAYLVSDGFNYMQREFQFLAPGRLVGNLTRAEVESGEIAPAGTPTFLILTREQAYLIPYLQVHYPGEYVETIPGNSPGEVGFYVFRLPPETPSFLRNPDADLAF